MRPNDLQTVLAEKGAQFGTEGTTPAVLHFGDSAAEAAAAFSGGVVRDESARARVYVTGPEAVSFVNGQCTNDIAQASESKAVPAVLTNPKGRVIDHMVAVKDGERLLVLASHGQGEALAQHFNSKIVMEKCEVADASTEIGGFMVFGEKASGTVQQLFGAAPAEAWSAAKGTYQEQPCIVIAVPAPGGLGFEILMPNDQCAAAYTGLCDAGLVPIGEQAFDSLRIEAGFPALGKEMGDHANPLEAGLGDSVSFTKGCYVGQEVVARLSNYGKVKRQLAGIRFPHGVDVSDLGEVFWDLLRVGNVTSATHSARLDATIALALVKTDYAKPGTDVFAMVNGERVEGKICELPATAE